MRNAPALRPASEIIAIPADLHHRLPEYAEELTAFHNAFGRELGDLVRELPVEPGARILDLACGDGFFTACFARRHPLSAEVVAADNSPAFLELARRVADRSGGGAAVAFAEADAYALPFAAGSFDAVWCAQSLISLADAPKALQEMHRVLKPGGWAAILENDDLHHLLPNMPIDLELAVFKALATRRAERGREGKTSPVRRVVPLLEETGFRGVAKRSVSFDRSAPFDPSTCRFAAAHFAELRGEIAEYLSDRDRNWFDRYTSGRSEDSFFRNPASELTCLFSLVTAVR